MQWIGAKHKQMQCFFVALLAGTLNVDDHVLTVIHALTDFIYSMLSAAHLRYTKYNAGLSQQIS